VSTSVFASAFASVLQDLEMEDKDLAQTIAFAQAVARAQDSDFFYV